MDDAQDAGRADSPSPRARILRGMLDTLPDWAGQLIDCGGRLPRELEERILALGEAAREPLLEVLERRALWMEGAPGDGMAPVHAVRLLGRLDPASETVDRVLTALADLDVLDLLANEIVHMLKEWGPAVAPVVLAAAQRGCRLDTRLNHLEVLANCGARSDAIYDLLLAFLLEGEDLGPGFLATYGDARALPEVHRAFEALRLDSRPSFFVNQQVFEFEDAVLTLGGSLTPRESAMVEVTHTLRDVAIDLAVRDAQHLPAARDRATRWGDPARPNVACGCGSGRKYKKCHLDDDDDDV